MADVDVFMPLYIGDYLADTQDLSAEEHGAYLLLLMNMWRRGGEIPARHDRLAAIARVEPSRWQDVWSAIERFFEPVSAGGALRQKRLASELDAARGRRANAAENGRRGAAARWNKPAAPQDGVAIDSPLADGWGGHDSAIDLPLANTMAKNDSSPSPSPSPSPSESKSPSTSQRGTRARARGTLAPYDGPSQPPANLYEQTLAAFAASWQDRYAAEYRPTPADKTQLGRLLSSLDRDAAAALPELFARYLEDHEPFVAQKQRHSLTFFCTSGGVNKYAARPGILLSEKEARGVAASKSWLDWSEQRERNAKTNET